METTEEIKNQLEKELYGDKVQFKEAGTEETKEEEEVAEPVVNKAEQQPLKK